MINFAICTLSATHYVVNSIQKWAFVLDKTNWLLYLPLAAAATNGADRLFSVASMFASFFTNNSTIFSLPTINDKMNVLNWLTAIFLSKFYDEPLSYVTKSCWTYESWFTVIIGKVNIINKFIDSIQIICIYNVWHNKFASNFKNYDVKSVTFTSPESMALKSELSISVLLQ